MATVAAKNVAVTNASPKTSASVSVAAGDLLVVFGYGQDGTTLNNPTNSGAAVGPWTLWQSKEPGTTWTTQYVWTAPVTAADSAVTVSVSRKAAGSPSSAYGFTVLAVTGASTIGASVADLGTGVPSLSLTTGANSVIVYGAGDWNPATGSASWLSINGSTGVQDLDTTPGDRFYVRHWLDSGAAGAKTVGMSAPSGQKWAAVALELQTTQPVGGSDTIRWDVVAPVFGSDTIRWDTKNVMVGGSDTVQWGVAGSVGGSDTISWDSQWLGTWRELVNTPEWAGMVTSRHRIVSARAEWVDRDGNSLEPFDFVAASIDFRGESSEQWAGSVEFAGPELAPRKPTDPLDPRSDMRARFWWRVQHQGQWFEVPVGTFLLDDPRVSDSGAVQVSATARDTLTVIRRTGYGDGLVSVGGLTVDQALKRLFAAIAPWAQISVPATTIALPSTYQLGLDNADPAQDWTKLASMAGWVVRTDRMGVVVIGPPAERAGIVADWQDGPDAPAVSFDRSISNSNLKNRVIVRSTNSEAVGVYAVAEDDDPGSPTWVGRFGPFTMVIESDAIKTEAAALNMARMQLGSHLRPSESVQVTVPQRPDLEYRDQIALARDAAGVGGTYLVSGWSLKLVSGDASPSTMTVTMMARTTE